MLKNQNKKNQTARIPTDDEIIQMQRKYIEKSAWEIAMQVKVQELAANRKLVCIKSDEGNAFIISS